MAAVALCVPLHSHAIFGFGDDDDEAEGRDVWRSGEQYVRIVPAEEVGNEHPAEIEPGVLVHALRQIMAKQDKRFLYYGQYDPVPLFQPQMAATLGKALHKALAEATGEEDVVFLMQGSYSTLSIMRDILGITGRAFFSGGRLHIIFGEMLRSEQQSGEFNSDLRGLDYETAGRSVRYRGASRSRSIDSGWQLVPVEGVAIHSGRERNDWIELDMAAIASHKKDSEPEETVATPADQEERRQMLLDMARMRKDIEQLRQSTADGGDGGGAVSAAAAGPDDVQRRLQTLKALHENELISDEEYQAKRREIIDKL